MANRYQTYCNRENSLCYTIRIVSIVADPDPASWMGKNQDPDLDYGINIPNHISRSLETIFWIKNT
jgi:hypothetical protein